MKIPPMEAELFHATWQADMTKRILEFRNVTNARTKPMRRTQPHPLPLFLHLPNGTCSTVNIRCKSLQEWYFETLHI